MDVFSSVVLKPCVSKSEYIRTFIDDRPASKGDHEHIFEEIDWSQRWDTLLAKDQAKTQ
jgi:hypothetical protein